MWRCELWSPAPEQDSLCWLGCVLGQQAVGRD